MADKKQDKAEDAAATVDPEAQDTDPTAGDGASEGESAAESTGEPPSGHVDAADAESGDTDLFETLVAERDALKDQLLRALADVENMRRRTERELGRPANTAIPASRAILSVPSTIWPCARCGAWRRRCVRRVGRGARYRSRDELDRDPVDHGAARREANQSAWREVRLQPPSGDV